MNADKAINKWAGKRLGIHPDTITKVNFGTYDEGFCETCSYTIAGVEVSYKTKKGGTKSEFINLGYESFADVLNEILEGSK